MKRFFSPLWASLTAAVVGVATWVYVSRVSDRREAWDSEIYFTQALPVIALVAAAVAFQVPQRPWRWAMIPFAAQALVMVVQDPLGNLLPLGLIMFAIFGGVCAIPAVIAASLSRKPKS